MIKQITSIGKKEYLDFANDRIEWTISKSDYGENAKCILGDYIFFIPVQTSHTGAKYAIITELYQKNYADKKVGDSKMFKLFKKGSKIRNDYTLINFSQLQELLTKERNKEQAQPTIGDVQ